MPCPSRSSTTRSSRVRSRFFPDPVLGPTRHARQLAMPATVAPGLGIKRSGPAPWQHHVVDELDGNPEQRRRRPVWLPSSTTSTTRGRSSTGSGLPILVPQHLPQAEGHKNQPPWDTSIAMAATCPRRRPILAYRWSRGSGHTSTALQTEVNVFPSPSETAAQSLGTSGLS
jgi:hypothetical protein